MDDRIFHMIWRWCRRRHRQKSARWIKKTYFQRVGGRDWVFGGTLYDRKERTQPIVLRKASDMRIVRHVKVRGDANPYDPKWELYFEERSFAKTQKTLAGRGRVEYLYTRQGGKCASCRQQLQATDPWHIHHREWLSLGGSDREDNLELLHANCHRQKHSKGIGNEISRVSPRGASESTSRMR